MRSNLLRNRSSDQIRTKWDQIQTEAYKLKKHSLFEEAEEVNQS
jgi:hypothetical protein